MLGFFVFLVETRPMAISSANIFKINILIINDLNIIYGPSVFNIGINKD